MFFVPLIYSVTDPHVMLSAVAFALISFAFYALCPWLPFIIWKNFENEIYEMNQLCLDLS